MHLICSLLFSGSFQPRRCLSERSSMRQIARGNFRDSRHCLPNCGQTAASQDENMTPSASVSLLRRGKEHIQSGVLLIFLCLLFFRLFCCSLTFLPHLPTGRLFGALLATPRLSLPSRCHLNNRVTPLPLRTDWGDEAARRCWPPAWPRAKCGGRWWGDQGASVCLFFPEAPSPHV